MGNPYGDDAHRPGHAAGHARPPGPGAPPRRKHTARNVVLWSAGGLAVLAIVIAAEATRPKAPAPAASPSPRASLRIPSAPALTGFGATLAQWKAAHRLDLTVPARNAYLPHLDGEDTWQLVTVASGRVTSYTLNVPPGSLGSAEARARRELPPDARVLWARTVPGKPGVPGGDCSQEQFESAELAAVLGDGQVNVEFLNGSAGGAAPVTEELFSTQDAPTAAQAPAC
jgi:hypothetical protein